MDVYTQLLQSHTHTHIYTHTRAERKRFSTALLPSRTYDSPTWFLVTVIYEHTLFLNFRDKFTYIIRFVEIMFCI